MKHNQNRYFQGLNRLLGLVLMVSFGLSLTAQAAPVDLATIPLANSPTITIQPNLLYILDDSGSMSRDYMPNWVDDDATEYAAFGNDAVYNVMAYNPALRYLPPANFDGSGLNTTEYPSQTGLTTATGANFQAKPNWKRVKRDPYLSGSTDNITSGAGYRTTLPGEHCTLAGLKVCVAQATPSASHPFPAPIRWCNSTANASAATPAPGSCQGSRVGSFTRLRAPVGAGGTATITITSSSSKPKILGITVDGQQIMKNSPNANTNQLNQLANRIKNKINQCTASIVGSCTIAGYSATRAGNVVTITAPGAASTPVLSFNDGSLGFTVTPFTGASLGSRVSVSIVPGNNSYPYPGSPNKTPSRTDCAASTCTYVEEMTNYANWYAYYRTRMLLMKTATSLGFAAVGDDFRVGYMTINPFGNQRLNFDTFVTTHKVAWYTKLFATSVGGSTPLRQALSQAGRIYADKETIGGTFTDPIEYECQQNFTLLTTDGGWNSSGGRKLNNSTMGNYDGGLTLPPYYEGSNARSNTLADTAKYYRDTDLRTSALGNCSGALGSSVCETPSLSPIPPNQKQTMVTLTLGLGVDGELAYTADYKTATVGDFSDIKAGTKNWPNPLPGSDNNPARTDDLWHAAVNGDGTYFSAKRPNELVQQLQEAIASIKIKTGASAAAATSTLNPIAGDNFAFFSGYTSGHWTGNLEKREIDPVTGEISPAALACVEDIVTSSTCLSPSSILPDGIGGYDCVTPNVLTPAACAGTLVGTDCKEPVIPSCNGALKLQATRTILFNQSGSLQPFDYVNLNSAQKASMASGFLQLNLTQGASLSPVQLANLTGPNLVEYVKGDTSFDEGAINSDDRVFRKRHAILGDLIDSEPVYVADSPLNYSDPGYQDFKTAQAGRAKTVYVGGNDGMLHAFNADTLQERWAYVPSMVISNLWRLADFNYSAKHANFVNGDPVVGDICIAADCTIATANDWRTILVGGLDGGGRGYYALDITNPLSPLLLWEFAAGGTINNDPNLGYSYSNPIITKRALDGKWAVIFASGYNNIPDNNAFYSLPGTKFKPNNPAQHTTGDGLGRLFILNAATGVKLEVIDTSVGTVATPSGLAKINAFVDDASTNNETRYIYGGDLLGNLWRFDIYSNSVIKFATLAAGGPQPITTVPELGEIKGKRVIFVGTGKYLEVSDLVDTSLQTLYAIKDDNAVATLVNPRASLVAQTLVPGNPGERVGGPAQPVDFTTGRGWYIDFPDTGERQGIASQLVLGTLLVPTVVPTSSACQPAGYGWLSFLDYKTGTAVEVGGFVSKQTTSPLVGLNVVYIDGTPSVFGTTADGEKYKIDGVPFASSGTGFQTKRSIWREIIE